jgi:predicted permease
MKFGGMMMNAVIRLFHTLARAYPEEFRAIYGPDMEAATEDMVRSMQARRGWRRSLVPLLGMLFDMLLRLPAEYGAEMRQDARLAMRLMRKTPVVTAAAAISLGIGISSVTGMFSLFDRVVLSPTPQVAAPERLVRLRGAASYPDYEHYRDASRSTEAISAYIAPVPFVMKHEREAERIWGHIVSPDYFTTLGTPMYAGAAGFRAGHPTAVLSYQLWHRRFGGSRAILGQTVSINGKAVEITGVAAAGFQGASPMMTAADLFLPTTVQEQVAPELARGALTDRKVAAFQVICRLAPGATTREAESELDGMARRLEQSRGDTEAAQDTARRVELIPGGRLLPVPDRNLPMLMSFPLLINGLTLWIAGASVAHMLLARTAERSRELAVRLSLGASRARLVRQLLTETMLIALLAGVIGLGLSWWSLVSLGDILSLMPEYVRLTVPLDLRSALFTAAIAIASGIAIGAVQAFEMTRRGLNEALKSGSNSRLRKYKALSSRNLLVLQQVAASLMILMLTAWVAIGFRQVADTQLGFDIRNLHMMSLDPVRDGYSVGRARQFLEELPDRVRTLPGIRDAAIAQTRPFTGLGTGRQASVVEGNATRSLPKIQVEAVGHGLLETAGIQLIGGRSFSASNQGGAPEAVINARLAAEIAADQTALGKLIEIGGERYQVAGVAGNVRRSMLFEPQQPVLYRLARAEELERPTREGVALLVRTDPGVDAAGAVRKMLSIEDGDVTVFAATTIADELKKTMWLARYTAATYTVIGVFGLMLALTGLAGVTAQAVIRRTKEIGIRIALGAQHHAVIRMVMREGMVLVAVGLVAGFVSALAIARLMGAHMDSLAATLDLSITSPIVSIGAPLLLALVSLAACWAPARRSAKIDPATALRAE